MGIRKPEPKAAAAKVKMRKNHGPKRHMFHGWNKAIRTEFGRLGILDKFHNKESFALSLNARGIKSDIDKYWIEFCSLSAAKRKTYFESLGK